MSRYHAVALLLSIVVAASIGYAMVHPLSLAS